MKTLILGLLVVVGIAALTGVSSPPAEAASTCNRIYAVMRGAGGDSTVQYVEIRMPVAGQNNVSGNVLKFYDAIGNLVNSYTIPTDVANGAAGSSILIGTASFASQSTVTPDFTMPVGVVGPAGKVQLVGTTNCTSTGTIIDSVAYGNFTGTADCGTPAVAATGIPTTGAQALTLNNQNQTCTNNSTEYSLQTAAPRNNTGQTGSLVLPDFSFSCSPASLTVAQGGSTTSTCGINSINNFNASVNLSCTGQPAPITCGYNPNPAAPPAGGSINTTLTVSLAPNQALGTFSFQALATSGSLSHTFTLTVKNDSDADGVADNTDNCPFWSNPSQALPPWTVPSGDPDCDGFTTTIENHVGTNPNLQCGVAAWPPDFNDDHTVNLLDVIALKPHFASAPPNIHYNVRFDLSGDNQINLSDILIMKPFFGRTCS